MKGPPMRTSRTRSRFQALGALATGLVLAGCATMPSTGAPPAQPVSGANTQAAQQVVVVAEPPKATDLPNQLVSSFLDDLVSDEQNYDTAKQFLTTAAAKVWNPQQQVTVLQQVTATLDGDPTATRAKIKVSGSLVATLNSRHAYVPAGNVKNYNHEFTLLKGPQGWRIDTPPNGIILNEVDFARIYEPVNLYFPVARPNGVGSSTSSPSALVADPIYVRSHIDPLTDAANALLGGPSDWLRPAVSTSFPPASSLGRGRVNIGGDAGGNGVSIQLVGAMGAKVENRFTCDRMAAQLYFTLSEIPTQQAQQSGQKIDSVSLFRKGDGNVACRAVSDSRYSPFDSMSGTTGGPTSYFVGPTGRLEGLDVGQSKPSPKPVTGALAPASIGHIAGFAVAPGSSGKVAVLSSNQRDLYVSTLTQATAPAHPTLSSAVTGGLSSPSWDGLGTLWVADTNPAAPAVHAVVGSKLVTVPVNGLQGTVTGVRVAADGARIALTVRNGADDSVQVGRIEQSGTAAAPVLTVDGLQPVTPAALTSVKSVSWFDGDSLIVLGQSVGTAPGLSTWEVDGSSVLVGDGQVLSPADGMTTVAALPQDSSLENGVKAPLLGDSNGSAETTGNADKGKGKIYRWTKNQWQEVAQGDTTGNGPMPAYPG